MGKLIFISGISGTGKSTIGRLLTSFLSNAIWIDQDLFYKFKKPKIKSPYGDLDNWDDDDSIDYQQFENRILSAKKQYDHVIVTGFALRHYLLPHINPDYHFLFTFLLPVTDENNINYIIRARQQSKNFNTQLKKDKDMWMVIHVVWPYYLKTLLYIDNLYIIKVLDSDYQYIDKFKLVNDILNIIS
ncbi:MAG TPA: hypothetical protein VLG50_07550 [Candidatus Saccharimonadales bacterium]|nr:hypothetical protein [Candidatus Saccharimonadales bacterium]